MIAKKAGKLADEQGSTQVEYALVFLLFMTMILGTIDFARALYTYHFLSNAAREGTRWAAVNGATCNNDSSCNGGGYMNNGPANQADISTYIKNNLTPLGIDTSKLTVTASWPGTGSGCTTANSPGCPVQVQVSYNFSFFSPLVYKNGLTLSSSSEMTISH